VPYSSEKLTINVCAIHQRQPVDADDALPLGTIRDQEPKLANNLTLNLIFKSLVLLLVGSKEISSGKVGVRLAIKNAT